MADGSLPNIFDRMTRRQLNIGDRIGSVAIAIALLVSVAFYGKWGKETYPFYGDSMGYYMYLPSSIIYHNLKALDWLPEDIHFDHTVRSVTAGMRKDPGWGPKGYIVNKYTYGVAVFDLPFFLIAHFYELVIGDSPTGYGDSYRHALKISSIVYTLLALFILYKVLRRKFDGNVSLLSIAVIWVGTNVFWFGFAQSGMAHTPLFLLYALLLYSSISMHESFRKRYFVLSGICCGLITVIRPTDVVCILIPLLINVSNRQAFLARLRLIGQKKWLLTILLASFIFPILPQLLYWKKFAGSFFYYSYGSEGFNWSNPKIFEGLLGFRNGWLIYTPIMVLAIIGLARYRRIRWIMLPLMLILPVYIYTVYSWHCYNYINGLGSRPMIHLYPLLAIPLAAVLEYVLGLRPVIKGIGLAVVMLLVSLNLSFSAQRVLGILPTEESSGAYTLNMLFKFSASYDDLVLYDIEEVQPKRNSIRLVTNLAELNFDSGSNPNYVYDSNKGKGNVYHVDQATEYPSERISITADDPKRIAGKWLKASGRFLCTEVYMYYKHLLVLSVSRGDSTYHWKGVKIDNKIGLLQPDDSSSFTFDNMRLNQWSPIEFFCRVPVSVQAGDKIDLSIWNIGFTEMFFDDLRLQLYEDR